MGITAISVFWLIAAAVAAELPRSLVEAKAEYDAARGELLAAADAVGVERLRDQLGWTTEQRMRAAAYMATVAVSEHVVTELDEAPFEQDPNFWRHRTQQLRRDIRLIRALTDAQPQADPWAGTWDDGYRGTLRVVERDGRLWFDLKVVRGPTHHLGRIGGVAQVNEQLARFTDRGARDPALGGGETWLTFVRRGNVIEVIGANTSHYHGARAYFNGRYVRVGTLTAAQQDEVVANGDGRVLQR